MSQFPNKKFQRKQMFLNQSIITVNLFMMNKLITMIVRKEINLNFIIQRKSMEENFGYIELSLVRNARLKKCVPHHHGEDISIVGRMSTLSSVLKKG